jgi:hypothetical protein
MFEQELDNLLQKNWSDEERRLITLLMENVIYYKKLIPKSLKQDIMNALQMCNVLKTELEIYRAKCNCLASKNVSTIISPEEECKSSECKCTECKCAESDKTLGEIDVQETKSLDGGPGTYPDPETGLFESSSSNV